MTGDGADPKPAPHLLSQVHRHLPRVACLDEVLKERRRQVLGEDTLIAITPQVELEGLGFDQGFFRAVAELQLVEVGLAGGRARRGQLVTACVKTIEPVCSTRPARTESLPAWSMNAASSMLLTVAVVVNSTVAYTSPWLHGTTSSCSAVIGPLASRPRTRSRFCCTIYPYLTLVRSLAAKY